MDTDKKEIKVYVYLDKIYIITMIIFLIIGIFIIPTQYLFYVFVTFILVIGCIYLYRNNVLSVDNINTPIIQTKKTKSSKLPKEEVFHIANNIFTYDQAVEVCGAYNARLATYKDMENAYKTGADWCTYGWSDNNNIFFPTQANTVDKLSKIPGHEHDCGHEGVNGGYIEDGNTKFGVNCYGVKPNQTEADTILQAILPLTPLNEQEIEMERKIEYWKNKKSELLLRPFNNDSWNESFVRI